MSDSDQRQTLIDRAAQAFARHGYAGASVRVITDAARMNPAMVGYYFESKEGLFRAVLADRDARIRERVAWAERGADSAAAARERAYIFAVLEEYPELLAILFAHVALAEDGFPADGCRGLLAAHRTLLGGSDVLDRLAIEVCFSPTSFVDRTEAERRALAEALAPRTVARRKASVKAAAVAAVEEPEEVLARYAQPSRGDDFLDGFVD